MQLPVILTSSVIWLLACLTGANFASPERSYRTSSLTESADYYPHERFPSDINYRNHYQSSLNLNSPYESIDQFQLEQQLRNRPDQSDQVRSNYEDQYSNQFQESYYQRLLRVTENPLTELENQETFTSPQGSQAYYQDYLPLDGNDEIYSPADEHDVKSIGKNSKDQNVDAFVKKFISKDNSYTQSSKDLEALNSLENEIFAHQGGDRDQIKRGVRQVRVQRPGFLWTIARLAFEKVNDTKSAVNQIGTIVSDAISVDNGTSTTARSPIIVNTTPANINNNTISGGRRTTTTTTTTTTEAPFRLTRPILQGILRRNIKGLIRLFNIEWRDAVNASRTSVRDFQRDLGNQVRPFLEDNPRVFG